MYVCDDVFVYDCNQMMVYVWCVMVHTCDNVCDGVWGSDICMMVYWCDGVPSEATVCIMVYGCDYMVVMVYGGDGVYVCNDVFDVLYV